MEVLPSFEVPIGRNSKGGALHWKQPGCEFLTAYCTLEAFRNLGGYMYGVAVACVEDIALLKFEAGQLAADGSVIISEEDLTLLRSLDSESSHS
jgi:hypothetical protein